MTPTHRRRAILPGMRRDRRRAFASFPGAVALAAAVGLAACGSSGSGSPAICGSVNTLQKSVDNLKNDAITPNGLSSVSSDLQQVKNDLTTVKTDAKSQYQPQVNAVSNAVSGVSSAVSAAGAHPSASSLSTVGTAVKNLGNSVVDLKNVVASTC